MSCNYLPKFPDFPRRELTLQILEWCNELNIVLTIEEIIDMETSELIDKLAFTYDPRNIIYKHYLSLANRTVIFKDVKRPL